MSQSAYDRKINYVEFPVPDVNVAKKFYGEVFGWEFQDWGPDYVSFNDGKMEGGFRGGQTPRLGGPLVILYSLDLEDIEWRVVAAGGKISTPTFEFPGGRRFHFIDPCGNELAIWSDRPGR